MQCSVAVFLLKKKKEVYWSIQFLVEKVLILMHFLVNLLYRNSFLENKILREFNLYMFNETDSFCIKRRSNLYLYSRII